MKKIKELVMWKKILIIISFLLVLLRITYICVWGEIEKEYIFWDEYDFSTATVIDCKNISQEFSCDNDRLNSIELMFSNIPEDKVGAVKIAILVDNDLIYQARISLSRITIGEWKKVYVNAPVKPGERNKIILSATEDCTQIPQLLIVKNECSPEIISSYSGDTAIDGNIAIRYGFLKQPSYMDRVIVSSLWLIFLIIDIFIIINIQYIFNLKNELWSIIQRNNYMQLYYLCFELLICTIIIGCSGIEFQEPTKIILYLISLLSVINIEAKNKYCYNIADKKWKKILIYCGYIYSAFSLVGQRIFIFPLNVKLTVASMTVFVAAILWFIPVVNSIMYYEKYFTNKAFSDTKKIKDWIFILVIILILILPALYNLYANNPGITSPDSYYSMVVNAGNIYGMYDWHPFFYSLVLKCILSIWNSTYMVIIVQYIMYAYVICEVMIYLRSKGLKETFLLGVAVAFGCNAGNYLHINTIWKDIPYSLSLLWLLLIISKLTIDHDIYIRKWYIYFELVIALVGVDLYRKNGVITFIFVLLCIFPLIKTNYKIVISIILSIGVIYTVNGPLYNYYDVESPGRRGMYIGLGADVMGAYYYNGEVNDSTLKFISKLSDYNIAEYYYNPTSSNATWDSYNIDLEPVFFIENYIKTFIRNPVLVSRALIDRMDIIWDIYNGQESIVGCVNYTLSVDTNEEWRDLWDDWNNIYQERRYVALTYEQLEASAYTARTQWINAIEWRCGLLTLLGVISILNLLICGEIRNTVIIISPIAGQIFSLMVSTGWSEYRYFWSLNLMNMLLVILSIVVVKEKNQDSINVTEDSALEK